MSKSAKAKFPETDNPKVSLRVDGKVNARVDGKDSVTVDSKVIARLEGVRRFRMNWRRFDYYPAPDALKEIDRIRELNPEHTIGQLIDYLVLQGIKTTSGNTQR